MEPGANGSVAPAATQLALFGQPAGLDSPRQHAVAGCAAPTADERADLMSRARGIAETHVCWRSDFGRVETQAALPWQGDDAWSLPEPLPPEVIRRLAATPIEPLFCERFVRLCRPGGWLAVVLPAGPLVRERRIR
jgi:hypothetical protein